MADVVNDQLDRLKREIEEENAEKRARLKSLLPPT